MTEPLPAAVRGAIDAVNLGDADQFVASFRTHRGFVDDWGRTHHGASAIRQWTCRLIAAHTVVRVVHFYRPSSQEVVVIARVRADDADGPATLTFILQGESIDALHVTA